MGRALIAYAASDEKDTASAVSFYLGVIPSQAENLLCVICRPHEEASMFERYTDDARRVIFFARYEASRLGSLVLETEHLWLGLLRQNKRLMKRLAPQVTVDSVSRNLIPPAPNAARISMTVDLPLSDATHSVFSAAEAEADRIGQRYITSESLIVALLRETTAAA